MLGADVPPEVENDLVIRLELDRLAQREKDGKPGEHAWDKKYYAFLFHLSLSLSIWKPKEIERHTW